MGRAQDEISAVVISILHVADKVFVRTLALHIHPNTSPRTPHHIKQSPLTNTLTYMRGHISHILCQAPTSYRRNAQQKISLSRNYTIERDLQQYSK